MEPGPATVVGASCVDEWLASLTSADLDDAALIDAIRECEDLKNKAAAAQVVLTAKLAASQRAAHEGIGLRKSQQGRGVGAQIALARRESPHRGNQLAGLSEVLVKEMPHTFAGMRSGALPEYRAQILARETACLSLEDRRAVDEQLCGDITRIEGWGNRRLAGEARQLAAKLDAAAVVKRAAKATSERTVTVRPAPDVMTYVTALLPVAQGVGVYAALSTCADQLRAAGDPRSRGQIMADTLFERVTGRSVVEGVPIAVNLTVSDETLLAGGHAPAWVSGYGPIPAGTARDLVATAVAQSMATLRRLYVTPTTGQLTQMDSVARLFPTNLALFIDLRDQTCRTPWCDAPIRHHDHIAGWINGAPTSGGEGQGLCEQCSYDKEAPGWTAATVPDPTGHTVEISTPTGHRHRTRAPALPRPAPHVDIIRQSPAELLLSQYVLAG